MNALAERTNEIMDSDVAYYAGYNSPFTPTDRRNEVFVEANIAKELVEDMSINVEE